MKKYLLAIAFVSAASFAFGADARYALTEYTMNGCPACVAALKDVDELLAQGFDVRTVNTDVDRQAALEAARYRLPVRPAWRLARADGSEVGRWFGADKAGIIAATIRAKFPTPDEELPVAHDPIGTPEEEEEPQKEPTPKPSEVELEPVGAEVVDKPDFRERAPVAEIFGGVGFLEDAQKEWLDRKDKEEEERTSPYEKGKEEEEGDDLITRGRIFRNTPPSCEGGVCPSEPTDAALGDRIAERAARSFLQGITPKLDQAKQEAFRKFDKLGGDAKDALENRLAEEFQKARGELEKKFEREVDGIKAAILREIGAQFGKLAIKCAYLAALLFVVGWVVWLCGKNLNR